MNGIHDLGGMDNLGPLVRETDEPVFHEEWEGRIVANTIATLGAGYYKVDELRKFLELMPPADYLNATYYQKWLYVLEVLLLEKGVVTEHELQQGRSLDDSGMKLPAMPKEAAQFVMSNPLPAVLDVEVAPRFTVGDRIRARNINSHEHNRLPRYARDKPGEILKDYGVFALPDSVAHGRGENAQHCYSVRFRARDLWGEDAPAGDGIYLDLFDDYLEPLSGTGS